MKAKFSPCFKSLILVTALAMTVNVHGAETTDKVSVKKPWAFDLNTYLWLPRIDGNFTSGPFETSASPSFIDIMGKLRNFPMTFNGHFNAYYDRFGFYLDGSYMGLDFRPQVSRGESKGVSMRMGIMEYGASYRLLGNVSAIGAKTRVLIASTSMQVRALFGWVMKQNSHALVCQVTSLSPRLC
ncbi:MAG: hypothetical protein WCK96_00810 [Methylococcales bacterium]